MSMIVYIFSMVIVGGYCLTYIAPLLKKLNNPTQRGTVDPEVLAVVNYIEKTTGRVFEYSIVEKNIALIVITFAPVINTLVLLVGVGSYVSYFFNKNK